MLCIWLRCTEALESVMKKALGGNMGLAQSVGGSAGRGWWVVKEGCEMTDSAGSALQKGLPSFFSSFPLAQR